MLPCPTRWQNHAIQFEARNNFIAYEHKPIINSCGNVIPMHLNEAHPCRCAAPRLTPGTLTRLQYAAPSLLDRTVVVVDESITVYL